MTFEQWKETGKRIDSGRIYFGGYVIECISSIRIQGPLKWQVIFSNTCELFDGLLAAEKHLFECIKNEIKWEYR